MSNLKKFLLFSLLWWIIVSVEVGAVGSSSQLATTGDHGFVFNTTGLIIHFILMLLITISLSYFLFRKGVLSSVSNGFKFGLCIAITGLLLDALVTAPFFVKSYSFYFGKLSVWLGYVLVVVITTFYGAVTKKLSNK